jgi:putative transposase
MNASLGGLTVHSQDQNNAWRGKPSITRAENGLELVSGRLMERAVKYRIHLKHIHPRKPQQNAYVERFNCTVSYEWLPQQEWLYKYNHDYPNMALVGIAPKQ